MRTVGGGAGGRRAGGIGGRRTAVPGAAVGAGPGRRACAHAGRGGSAVGEQRAQALLGGAHGGGDLHRVVPGGIFFLAARVGERRGQQGQQVVGRGPVEQVGELQRLVAGVEQVPGVGVQPVRRGAVQQVGQLRRRHAVGHAGEQGALDRVAVAGQHPLPEPPLQGRVGGRRGKRIARPARGPVIRLGGQLADRVAHPQVQRLVAQPRRQARHAGEPHHAFAKTGHVGRRVVHHARHDRQQAAVTTEQADQALRLHQPDSHLHAAPQAPPVVGGVALLARAGRYPYLVAAHLGGVGDGVVGPQVEGAAARELEARLVPVAGQDAVLDAAAVERKAHVRAAVVHRVDACAVREHRHRAVARLRHHHAAPAYFIQARNRNHPVAYAAVAYATAIAPVAAAHTTPPRRPCGLGDPWRNPAALNAAMHPGPSPLVCDAGFHHRLPAPRNRRLRRRFRPSRPTTGSLSNPAGS